MKQVAGADSRVSPGHVGGETRVFGIYGFDLAFHCCLEPVEDLLSQFPSVGGEVVVDQFLENFRAGHEGVWMACGQIEILYGGSFVQMFPAGGVHRDIGVKK